MAFKIGRKVILLTGASGGLGIKLAPMFAKDGHQLALQGRDETRLKMAEDQCKLAHANSDSVYSVPAELTNMADAQNLVSSVIWRFGRIDVLVNNAGLSEIDSVHDAKEDIFDAVIKNNVKSTFCVTSAAVKYLEKSKGSIVNVSSMASLRQVPGYLTYGMAKAAVDHFTRSTAVELAPKGIRVNSINPGEIVTEPYPNMTEAEYRRWNGRSGEATPLRRIADVTDIYNVISFLMSDNASFLTGINIPVDGAFGLTFKVPWQD